MMKKEYKACDFVKFVVTGLYYNSTRKFRIVTSSFIHATGINLWKGNIWGVLENGKRVRLSKAVN